MSDTKTSEPIDIQILLDELKIKRPIIDKHSKLHINLTQFLDDHTKSLYESNKEKIHDKIDSCGNINLLHRKFIQSFVSWSDNHIKNAETILLFKEFCQIAILIFKIDNTII